MLKRFNHIFACLLLVLMPLQAFAAANMLVCNSVMQLQANAAQQANQQADKMPCHQAKNQAKNIDKHQEHNKQQLCKSNCTAVCANLNSLSVFTQHTPLLPTLAAEKTPVFSQQIYFSYTPPSLQRPPIFLV